MSSDQGPPGLFRNVSAQPFAPSFKEFVPSSSNTTSTTGGGVGARPFIPSSSTATVSGSISAPSFVPRGAGSAKPFIPGGARGISTGGTAPQKAVEDFGLPDEDDALGLSTGAGTGMKGDKELAAQAAQLFQSMRPGGGAPGGFGGGPAAGSFHGPPPTNNLPPGLGPPPGLAAGPSSQGPNAPLFVGGRGGNAGGRGRGGPPPFRSSGPPPSNRGGRGGRGGVGRGGMMKSMIGERGVSIGPGSSRPHVAAYAIAPGRMQLAGKFVAETLKQDMEQRTFLTMAQLDPESAAATGIPVTIQQFHSLYPLEDPAMAAEGPSQVLNVTTLMLKGIHSGDGAAYALRKFDARQVLPTADILAAGEAAIDHWTAIANHPNIVGLREAFVSDEMDAMPSLYICYDYYPGALTMEQAHVMPQESQNGIIRVPANEEQLWSYLVQFTSALRAAHTAGLAFGNAALAPSKVLLCPGARLRIGSIGITETLGEGPPADVARAQRKDLSCIGRLLLVLACAARNSPPTLDTLAGHYSRELCHIIAGCLAASEGSGFPNWRALGAALGDRVFDGLDTAQNTVDTLASSLQKEYDNGRIARLLIKLNMVLERPELNGNDRWAETGDRYLLKLYRDFVFHQVDENGGAITDWGPVIEALNKMDAGIEEKVMLLSRDEGSMLVVSYADVKRCLQAAYKEVVTSGKKEAGEGTLGGRNLRH